jgi:palmitoyltransferase
MDTCFYILGMFLICFATVIISGLSYSFFWILVPMIQRAHPNNPLWVGIHVGFVVFLLTNIIVNYVLCITAKHKGALYETVVRELAEATGFVYPETAEDVLHYKRDFEQRMILRIQRRHARRIQQQEQETATGAAPPPPSDGNAITQRRPNGDAAPQQAKKQEIKLPARRWMIMGPHEWGFCDNSKQPKPARSHYDHVTKQLVLNMDHYCPWMFNTVGYFNYRYFYNFLLFVSVGMLYGVSITWYPFLSVRGYEYRQQIKLSREQHAPETLHMFDFVPTPSERHAIAFSFLLCISVGMAVLILFGFHTYLLLTGQTTIEFHGNCANKRRAKQQKKKYQNLYDLGTKRNFQQIYGTGHPVWAIVIPSAREPQFLPLPMPGKEGLRPSDVGKKDHDERGPTIV